MWVLKYLPDWLIHLTVITGAVLYFANGILRFIPFFSLSRLPVKILGAVLLVGGIWLEGGNYYFNFARAEIARIEKESAEATAKVEKEYQSKLALTKQKGDSIVKYVDKFITKEADAKCVIPNNFVILHDSAVHNEVPDASRLTDESASGITLSTTAKTVVENYNTYNEVRQQLLSLQQWIKEQKKIRE